MRAPRPQGPQKPQGQVKKSGPPKPPQPGAPKPAEKPLCKECNRPHLGKCVWGTYKCFICKEEGRKAADFPNKSAPTIGKTYVMHAEEAEEEPDTILITGMIFVQGVANYTLLDLGATHSFISDTFIKRLNIIPDDMGLGFKVFIPSDDEMVALNIVKNLELRLYKDVVRADPVVLPMPEFDNILGMDWLTANGASIDFQHMTVSIRPPSGKPFIFERSRNKKMSHIISCMCPRKLIKRGCQAYLACVTSAHVPDSQKLEDVDIIRYFPSVFPEDVYGIPPDIEVEFSIELMSGTRVAFVGHIISRDGVEVDPSKVEAVKEWPLSKSVTEIRSFLGLAGYYRKFIQEFSSIEVPLTALTKKNAKFILRSECQESFDKLKQALISPSWQFQTWRSIDEAKGRKLYSEEDGIVQYQDRLWVPSGNSLREFVMKESHDTPYSIHPESTKMYKNLQLLYWWPGMKRDILRFVSGCLTCQQVKAGHQRPARKLKSLPIAE
ncbi:uncharacterized protein [Primulina eburnea]|uniref:uncharacterized protein n=1 Tax=Primulina eburnea TaxID=1245227 RepID=UPI003C6C6715